MCGDPGQRNGRTGGDPVPTRLVLIEDHDMVATAFATIIQYEPDLELVATARSWADGLAVTRAHHPDVVITDLRLPDGLATEHLEELRSTGSGPAVLIVTGAPTDKALVDALETGATGFLSKTQPMVELLDAVRKVARGEVVVAPELVHVLVGRLDHHHASTLTDREIDVLQHLADGLDTGKIATQLHLSPNTVRNHVSKVLVKLDVHSRLEAVSEATRRGIIAPPTPF